MSDNSSKGVLIATVASAIMGGGGATTMMNIDDRENILNKEIGKYIKRGFRVTSRTETTAQLVKPKNFSLLWAFLWFLLFGIGLLVYVFYYVAKKDQTAYLEVDELGNVKIT